MNRILITSGLAAALLAGCHPRPVTAVQTGQLDCPERQGQLTRLTQTGDGTACQYRAEDGTFIELRLVKVEGDVQSTLAGVERELVNFGLPQDGAARAPADDSAGAIAAAAVAAPPTGTVLDDAVRRAQAEAEADSRTMTGEADGDWEASASSAGRGPHGGEQVRVALPGLSIDAKEDSANIRIGPVRIDASETGATVRLFREVRLKGEALSREKRGIRATYLKAGRADADGADFVGYEAGGPRSGPLVVALVRGTERRDEGKMVDDIQKLVRRNSGA
ncbi:hypothetical protein [Phenylobacterium sp.]|uniref:hypothetical protein n=1 Tax=Phenylobacterium sp. TaxID=1871053 RepID=UPI002FDAABE4